MLSLLSSEQYCGSLSPACRQLADLMEATEVALERTPIKSALLLYDPDYCE